MPEQEIPSNSGIDYRKLYMEELEKRIKAERDLAVERERVDNAVALIKLQIVTAVIQTNV